MSRIRHLEPRQERPLITENGCFVMVSHTELDDLIGRMMQIFELNGDVEQRNALKQETKWRCREWLDDLYYDSGWRQGEILKTARVIDVQQ